MSIEQRLAEIDERLNVSERIFPTTNVVINNELRFLLALVRRYREALELTDSMARVWQLDPDKSKNTMNLAFEKVRAALSFNPEEPK